MTANGLKQVFIKVDSDLLSGIGETNAALLAYVENIYPNPAKDEVTITLNVKESSEIKVEVFGLDGRRVAIVASQEMAAGRHDIHWNTKENGQQVPAGIYIVRLQTEQGLISRKLAITN
jgi:hypothetical protein